MKYGVEIKGMELNDEECGATENKLTKILQTYSEKLRKKKEEDDNG